MDFKAGSLPQAYDSKNPIASGKWDGNNLVSRQAKKYLWHLNVLGAIVMMLSTEWPGIC